MEPVQCGLAHLADVAGGLRSAAADLTRATGYAVRTFGSLSGLRGIAVESTWLAAHLASYPLGLFREPIKENGVYRTDALQLNQRSLVVADVAAAGTPILLVHGILDNRSVFTVFRIALRRRGFGAVHAVNYSVLTGDLRTAAQELHGHVERLRKQTGAEKVHIVGHSLGGMIARYYVQLMGGSANVDTLVTLGSPHGGTLAAYAMPTPLARQLRPGSDVLTELARPAPGCTTRFLVVWSRMDQMILPQRNARLLHSDLHVEELELRDVGHLSLPIDPQTVHWVATRLAQPHTEDHPFRHRYEYLDRVRGGACPPSPHRRDIRTE
ncbi:esterase/lipase family protein [Pseudonocardia hispaniensis]|uniref:Esterase/lipase family protein n=1 Tax=Pseudonocardia hispaniensis TaxID=904933 RepID=A0ABW1IWX1_9PSEU